MSVKVCPPNCIGDCKECALEIMKLEAFEILKNKRVNLQFLKHSETYEKYRAFCLDYYGLDYGTEITEEEFKLLEAVLR